MTLFTAISFSSSGNEIAKPWQLKTQSGDIINFDQYKNKPVILHFWATWCPYCKKNTTKLSCTTEKISSARDSAYLNKF